MKRILIVDDAATVRMYHRGDVNMPKLDGYGFLRELRQQEIPQAPSIMVSTEAAERDETAAYRAGANGYLIKPVKPAQLLAHAGLMLGEANQ